MNTIGNQSAPRTTTENSGNLRGTSQGMSTGGGGVSVTNVSAARQTAQITGNMILSQLQPGTKFTGDIIDVRGAAIKILLSGDKMLNATTTDARNLNIGDRITFDVTSNNGKSVVIRPININHYNTNMLLRALEAAEIPANERNQSIVKAMMRHEMPIDKNSILNMMKKIEGFDTDQPQQIVEMDRHGIPITQENINQFAAYKSCEHRIMAQTESMSREIPDMLSEIIGTGDENKAVSVAKELINILSESPLYENDPAGVTEKTNMSGNLIENATNLMKSDMQLDDNDAVFLKTMGLTDGGVVYESENTVSGEYKELPTMENVLNKLNTLTGSELKEFIESDDFKEFLRDKIERSLEINVNSLDDNDEKTKELVKKLYDNLDNKTNALLEFLNNQGEGQSKLAQTAHNIRGNMQFMQDMSQMASYIQLPVKFSENKAHSELYVYNRKKGMPVDKEVITAFLHLDMESLGATDINITMEKNSVITQFSLCDIESMRIVEENLPMLKERLEKKGYIATFTVDTQEDVSSDIPFDTVLETDMPQISIKRYSFDVRA